MYDDNANRHAMMDIILNRETKLLHPLTHGRRNFKDTNPLMSSSLVILFGVVKQFGRF